MDSAPSRLLALHFDKRMGELIDKLAAGAPFVQLVGNTASVQDFERVAAMARPDVILLEHPPDGDGFAAVVQRIQLLLPLTPLICLAAEKNPDQIMAALRLGLSEYLVDDRRLGDSFKEAMFRLRAAGQNLGPDAKGRVIGVMGAKGGVGVSHLAINLAWAISQEQGLRVALVDLDLFGGNGAFMLDQEVKRNFSDAAALQERLDAAAMEGLLHEVAPGLRLLAAPDDPADAEMINAEHVSSVLDVLARGYAVVVVDLGDSLAETTLTALDQAEMALLLLEPSLVGLKSAARVCWLSRRLGHGDGKLRPVVNRHDARRAIAGREIESVLNRKVLAWLPNEHDVITQAANAGQPALSLRPKAKWCKAVASLARQLLESPGEKP